MKTWPGGSGKRRIFRRETLLVERLYEVSIRNAALQQALGQINDLARIWDTSSHATHDLKKVAELARRARSTGGQEKTAMTSWSWWLTRSGWQRALLQHLRSAQAQQEDYRFALSQIHNIAGAWSLSDGATQDLADIASISGSALAALDK